VRLPSCASRKSRQKYLVPRGVSTDASPDRISGSLTNCKCKCGTISSIEKCNLHLTKTADWRGSTRIGDSTYTRTTFIVLGKQDYKRVAQEYRGISMTRSRSETITGIRFPRSGAAYVQLQIGVAASKDRFDESFDASCPKLLLNKCNSLLGHKPDSGARDAPAWVDLHLIILRYSR
jgi:hypothetical protein